MNPHVQRLAPQRRLIARLFKNGLSLLPLYASTVGLLSAAPAPSPTPEPPLNPKRLTPLHFKAWHSSEPGMIVAELYDLHHLEAPGSKPRPLGPERATASDYADARVSPSGKHQVEVNESVVGVRHTDCCAVQVFSYKVILSEVNSQENPTTLAEGDTARWDPKGWSPDGKYILFDGRLDDRFSGLFLVDADTKEKIPVLPSADRMIWRTGFAKNAKSLFVISLKGGGSYEFALERYDLGTKKMSTVTRLVGAEPEITFSPDGTRMALWFGTSTGTTTLVRANRVVLFDTESGAKTGEFELPRGLIYYARSAWRGDGREIGFSVSGENYTTDVYSVNAESGKLTRWYPPEGQTTGLYILPASR